MSKSEFVFGVYLYGEFKWRFFENEQDALDFRKEEKNRFGPHRFSFNIAIQQHSYDTLLLPESEFVTEDSFRKYLDGGEMELNYVFPVDETQVDSE